MNVESISAITIRVRDMRRSVRFYRDLLGLRLDYGGEESSFSTLNTRGDRPSTLNLERGEPEVDWGRIIFHVRDVDGFWAYLDEQGIVAHRPENASWGERYFHLRDPDGHELSIAEPQ